MRTLITLLLFLAISAPLLAQSGAYALTNGRIETVTNGVIERGTLLIREGRIERIGENLAIPSDAEVIDCSGLTIYPGMIDAGTQLGLVEIGSLSETRDDSEMGDLTPQAQALTAVNPNSVAIPVTRVNGVTTVLTSPSGGLLPGTGALVNLYGYTPEQMNVAGVHVLRINFPGRGRGGWWDHRTDEEVEEEWRSRMDKLDEVWDRAETYARIDSAWSVGGEKRLPEYVPVIEALLPAIRREMLVMVEVNQASDIDSAIAWVQRRNLRAVLSGLREGWRCADKIAASGIPCIVGQVLTTPSRGSDRYDKPYANPGLLRKAGVQVALRTNDVENVRNLPFQAGFAAAYGMSREDALRAVTIEPARILGVDSLLGSREVGKQATLFVADGDPLEPSTSVRHLFINGWNVPLKSRHTDLYDEFLNRTP